MLSDRDDFLQQQSDERNSIQDHIRENGHIPHDWNELPDAEKAKINKGEKPTNWGEGDHIVVEYNPNSWTLHPIGENDVSITQIFGEGTVNVTGGGTGRFFRGVGEMTGMTGVGNALGTVAETMGAGIDWFRGATSSRTYSRRQMSEAMGKEKISRKVEIDETYLRTDFEAKVIPDAIRPFNDLLQRSQGAGENFLEANKSLAKSYDHGISNIKEGISMTSKFVLETSKAGKASAEVMKASGEFITRLSEGKIPGSEAWDILSEQSIRNQANYDEAMESSRDERDRMEEDLKDLEESETERIEEQSNDDLLENGVDVGL
jgi:hypothetical protein